MKKHLLVTAALLLAPCAAFAQNPTTLLGPIMTTVTATTAATLAALPSNPSRKAVTICNGSATIIATFTTGTLTPVSLTTGIVLQTGNVVASCFTLGTPGSPSGSGVGAQINVIVNSTTAPITFVEYF